MIDFLRCLQNHKLLQTGQYMVISVDDEIYDPTKQSNIIGRGRLNSLKKKNNIFSAQLRNNIFSITVD